jgi:REP element-mobilizing transposase RayT
VPFDPKIHRRKSIRLSEYDYSQNGYYYITICTHNRECWFGKIVNGKMVLSEIAKIAYDEWVKTGQKRKNIQLDEWIIMPNHFHAIVTIENERNIPCRGVARNAPTNKMSSISPKYGSLPTIIRSFKSAVKRQCNKNGHEYFQWQRNYYEHIIRNENELDGIREYIVNNPLAWELDQNNPRDLWVII